MRKNILFLTLLTLLFSCGRQEDSAENMQPESQGDFSRQLPVDNNRTVTLTPEALAAVSEWLAYATAQDEIRSLEERTGQEILITSEKIGQIMESLRFTVPDTLQTPAVKARTNVLLTKAKVLEQLSNKKHKKADEIYDVANDLIVEFDNFKLQLNEVFLKSPTDFETELDEEFEEATSADTLPQPTGREVMTGREDL